VHSRTRAQPLGLPMKWIASIAAIALAFIAALPTLPAQAQNNRSFVSAQGGSDSNPCTRLAPCWTFAFAQTVVGAFGDYDFAHIKGTV
jgi:hypothetical protein